MHSASRTQAIASAMLADANPAPRRIHNYTVSLAPVELVPCPGCDLVPPLSRSYLPTFHCDGCYDGTEDSGDLSHLCGVGEHRFDARGAAIAWNKAVAGFIAERTLGPELPGEDSVWDWHEQRAREAGVVS